MEHKWFWWESMRERDHLEDPDMRWEDNIKMDIQEMGWRGHMDWIELAHNIDRWRLLYIQLGLLVP
jgi:hypothetical protein